MRIRFTKCECVIVMRKRNFLLKRENIVNLEFLFLKIKLILPLIEFFCSSFTFRTEESLSSRSFFPSTLLFGEEGY